MVEYTYDETKKKVDLAMYGQKVHYSNGHGSFHEEESSHANYREDQGLLS